ncbi:MAG: phosphatidylglycerol lysyltransferase domain-containing protein [Candidatus Woesebacteria bacterium]
MLPLFPNTKLLELSDKQEIERLTSVFSPYSDYYFFSLWTWNIDSCTRISVLEGNLVVLFHDYETNEPFLSFIGENNVEKTIQNLLDFTHKHANTNSLRLIPAECIEKILGNVQERFDVKEDRDSFDYVLSVEKLCTFEDSSLYTKRKTLNRFLSEHVARVSVIALKKKEQLQELRDLLSLWSGQKSVLNTLETRAEERMELNLDRFNLELLTVTEKEKIIGYLVFEIINSEYSICSFQRGDRACAGVYEYMNQEAAKYLLGKGIKYMNIEQDAGMLGLRQAKSAYDPTFLKKYTISLKG